MTTNTKPSHRMYSVRGENDQARWLEIGAAWPNKDGQGFTLQFGALPIGGRVVMREIAAIGEQTGGQS